MKKWWIFGADFFTVYAEFFTVYKGCKGWKKKHLVIWWTFSRLVFHGLPPLEQLGGNFGTEKIFSSPPSPPNSPQTSSQPLGPRSSPGRPPPPGTSNKRPTPLPFLEPRTPPSPVYAWNGCHLSNWHSHLETVHILGPKWVYFRPFRTTFSMIVAQIVVFIAISPFPPL